jgi:hypothetical protein
MASRARGRTVGAELAKGDAVADHVLGARAPGPAVFARARFARRAALAAGGVVLTWIVLQVTMIGYVS